MKQLAEFDAEKVAIRGKLFGVRFWAGQERKWRVVVEDNIHRLQMLDDEADVAAEILISPFAAEDLVFRVREGNIDIEADNIFTLEEMDEVGTPFDGSWPQDGEPQVVWVAVRDIGYELWKRGIALGSMVEYEPRIYDFSQMLDTPYIIFEGGDGPYRATRWDLAAVLALCESTHPAFWYDGGDAGRRMREILLADEEFKAMVEHHERDIQENGAEEYAQYREEYQGREL